jgi:hypothetical protein
VPDATLSARRPGGKTGGKSGSDPCPLRPNTKKIIIFSQQGPSRIATKIKKYFPDQNARNDDFRAFYGPWAVTGQNRHSHLLRFQPSV